MATTILHVVDWFLTKQDTAEPQPHAFDIQGLLRFLNEDTPRDNHILRTIYVQNDPWAELHLIDCFSIFDNERWADDYDRGSGSNAPALQDVLRWFWNHRPTTMALQQTITKTDVWGQQPCTAFLGRCTWRGITGIAFGARCVQMGLQNASSSTSGTPSSADNIQLLKDALRLDKRSMFVYAQFVTAEARKTNSAKFERSNNAQQVSTLIVFDHVSDESSRGSSIFEHFDVRLALEDQRAKTQNDAESLQNRSSIQAIRQAMQNVLDEIYKPWDEIQGRSQMSYDNLNTSIYENAAHPRLTRAAISQLHSATVLWLRLKDLASRQANNVAKYHDTVKIWGDQIDGAKMHKVHQQQERLLEISRKIDRKWIKPSGTLYSVIYAAAALQEAQASREVSISVWKFTLITFIFLPLTFVCGFFGMNVNIFQTEPGFPNVWIYFAVATPLLVLVFAFYFHLGSISPGEDFSTPDPRSPLGRIPFANRRDSTSQRSNGKQPLQRSLSLMPSRTMADGSPA